MQEKELIVVERVSKKFCRDLKTSLYYGALDIFRELFGIGSDHQDRLRQHEFWAIKDLSFKLRRGECLGLIGHNGAGKSTLLKMLNGLITPDQGSIRIKGRVAAIIELGAGFNPILTGRENIYNNGIVLGIKKKEIDSILDEIIQFSGLEKFIDTPVQFYSSGMKIRLGFAVAVHLKPDVLILDEVLAVGDAGFRIKSFNKISEMIKNAAVIFVSHSMPSVARVCNKASYLNQGKQIYHGNSVQNAINHYFNDFEGEKAFVEFNEGAEIVQVEINDIKDLDVKPKINYLDDLIIKLKVVLRKKVRNFYVMVQITDKDMKIVGQFFTNKFYDNFKAEKSSEIRIELKELQFIDGDYAITYFIAEDLGGGKYSYLASYRFFSKFMMRGLEDTLYASIHLSGRVFQNQHKLENKEDSK